MRSTTRFYIIVEMSDNTRLTAVMAQIDDPRAVDTVLVLLRDREAIATLLEKRESGFAFEYDDVIKTGRYLITDGSIVMCFSVTDVTAVEARSIADECRAMPEWGHEEFQAAVGRALDGYFIRVQ